MRLGNIAAGFAFVGCCLVGTAAPANAAPGDRIDFYRVDAKVEADGGVEVVESFDYTFANNPGRMPMDWIRPVRTFQLGPGGNWDKSHGGFLSYEKITVERDQRPIDTWVVNDGWWRKTWIGPLGEPPSGRHSYAIRYRLDGLVGADGAVNWSPLPGYDADRGRVRIRLRGALPSDTGQAACAIDGAQARCDVARTSDGLEFTGRDLPPGATLRLRAPTTARADGDTGPLPGVGEFVTANLERPGDRLGLGTNLVWGIVVLLGIVAASLLVLGVVRPIAPHRLRDAGAAIALSGIALGYPLGAYDLLIVAVPIALFGLLLAAIGFSLLRIDRLGATSPPGPVDRA